MECALCGRERELKNSHIIPEFVHRGVYDDKHRTRLFAHREVESQLLQKGLRERLLCSDCEQELGDLERYFSQYWCESNPLRPPITGREVRLSGVDYAKLKLLLLSVVWRASVSRMPEFDGASLGTLHETRMRELILSMDPGPESLYPVIGGVIVDSDTGEPWHQVILAPTKMRVGRHWAHTMAFAGTSWTIVTSSHFSLSPEELFLTESGNLRLLVATEREYAEATGLIDDARRMLERERPANKRIEQTSRHAR